MLHCFSNAGFKKLVITRDRQLFFFSSAFLHLFNGGSKTVCHFIGSIATMCNSGIYKVRFTCPTCLGQRFSFKGCPCACTCNLLQALFAISYFFCSTYMYSAYGARRVCCLVQQYIVCLVNAVCMVLFTRSNFLQAAIGLKFCVIPLWTRSSSLSFRPVGPFH